jgi:penicillin V acylase-like amidase (Ntn superfamily)
VSRRFHQHSLADRAEPGALLQWASPYARFTGGVFSYFGGSFLRDAAMSATLPVLIAALRAASVPLGITTPGEPNISSTIWRTVSDQKKLVYYFDSATRPNTFWVSLSKLDLKPGASVKKLTIDKGEIFSGEVSDKFVDAIPFGFLAAEPPRN